MSDQNISMRPFGTVSPTDMPCRLVSKNDPEKRGRIKVRFIHQLEDNIPDDKLPWTQPEGQTTAGAGNFTIGQYIIGQWFHGSTRDDGQTVTITKVISSDEGSNG